MPELPEVETVVRTLEVQIKNEKIKNIEVLWDNIIVGSVSEFKEKLTNQHFREFKRRGKYLVFKLDDIYLISHLRMEGKFFLKEKNDPINKHEHVVFEFYSGKQLRYHDTRKFGKMEIIEGEIDFDNFKNLGPEPWSDKFNLEYCKKELKKRKQPIKQVLLDQSFVAGVGNIYADEICFKIKTHPAKKCYLLSDDVIVNLIKATREILERAISLGGTTIRSYTSSLGVTGRFQLEVCVHQRENECCPVCNSKIIKTKVATRGTYYCPKCQKE
ncbi:MAG: DNA-formamidopyrimidine glycosylase [Anaerorhabdus sp.]